MEVNTWLFAGQLCACVRCVRQRKKLVLCIYTHRDLELAEKRVSFFQSVQSAVQDIFWHALWVVCMVANDANRG
jgi:hypothetical protein